MHSLLRPSAAVAIVALLGATTLAFSSVEASAQDAGAAASAAATPFSLVEDRDVDDRLPVPEDRYALAGGCYAIEAPGDGFVARGDGGLTLTDDRASAEPFHFQATRLGEYLIAANEGPDTSFEGAWWDVRSYLATAAGAVPVLTADGVALAEEPSEQAEWSIAATGDDPDKKAAPGTPQTYTITSSSGAGLTVEGGELRPADGAGSGFLFHHVEDDDPLDDDPNGTACADWPEITTNVTGEPRGNDRGPAGRVEGFFEAHIHGMAFEFLGGELRCGRPWHPYGVEYALPDCEDEEAAPSLNGVLEVAVAGQDPQDPFTSYDSVGWPTFSYWPKHDTLTHEQFYYKWLERAYLGGLRMFTNLLVDNTALCQVFPYKKNSCNEMDGVRLQAQRMYELQDYIDAQSGGPGEGWLRIVITPAQARQTINAGRLAVVLGIEVSELFDCREVLDMPQCTAEEIDDRLDEVFAMGVRQMELLNKFDSALAGVTGDGGATGVLVNNGNKLVTGHYWDMQTCVDEPHEHGHEHDKTQYNAADDVPHGQPEIDVLAGTIFGLFAPTKGAVAPAYPPAPHCNTRGLTDLGRHVIRGMAERGMIFDPDHMSAKAQREALDFVEQELIPAEGAAARAEGRQAIIPALISSHSWANEVVYKRIYELSGTVAPRTAPADEFVRRWAEHKAWSQEFAPPGTFFGMGYGADTNGLGSQPGPRTEPARPVDYATGWKAPIGDVTIHQQTSGLRTYDVTTDGVAHYGLFADWFRELALSAEEQYPGQGKANEIIRDLLNGSEDYLRLWERAVYGGGTCVVDQSSPQVEDLHAAIGLNFDGFLTAIGMPADRDGAAYTYCGVGTDGEPVVVDVLFDAEGRAVGVSPSASGLTPRAPAPDGHAHEHDGPGLPATGGGVAALAMLLLGLATSGARLLRARA